MCGSRREEEGRKECLREEGWRRGGRGKEEEEGEAEGGREEGEREGEWGPGREEETTSGSVLPITCIYQQTCHLTSHVAHHV